MLAEKARWLFTVITSFEEVLMTTTETPRSETGEVLEHEREAQDHITGCGNANHQSEVHIWTAYHWHMPFRIDL